MRLAELQPEWVPREGTGRLGFSCVCPRHPWTEERATVYFENPPDGDNPHPRACVTVVDPDLGLEHLTLIPEGGYPPDYQVQLGHWRGWLADGVLTESFIGGVGW